jgi:hypothetical protein
MRILSFVLACVVAAPLLVGTAASAYPLDAAESTGIDRLQAFDLAGESLLAQGRLVPGALWPSERVRLRLVDRPDFSLPAPDPELQASIRELLGADARAYGIVVLDLSDPANPRYAEHNPDLAQNPASVGKVMVALAFFQTLADVYPDAVGSRTRILTDTVVTANEFILKDHHEVPFWKPGDAKVVSRPIEQGDRANLYTYLDWMFSSSSSAAASQLLEQMLLIRHFGTAYPASPEASREYLKDTPKAQLGKELLSAMRGSIVANGLDWNQLRQGSFFTRTGKEKVPGTNSVATARQLGLLLTRIEQGRLVDAWSSLELKRLMYLTDWRMRYAAAPILADAAVYFKSGSLYGCKDEPGFQCGKFIGNKMNYMNSVVVVEEEKDGRSLHYIVALLSNVLKKNSAEQHEALGTRIHELIRAAHGPEAAGVQQ